MSDDTLLWVAIGDMHDSLGRLTEIPELAHADGLLISGDITQGGGVKQAERLLEAASEHVPALLAQIGNMDRPEVTDWLEEKGWNLHATLRRLTPEVGIMGVGGSTFTPFGTPSEFPESHFSIILEQLWEHARAFKHLVLVSHNPPRDTVCDLTSQGVHVGSTALREFIENAQPDVCICGHIHEARGLDRVGRTAVVNHGAFVSGGYVLLSLETGKPVVDLRMLDDRTSGSISLSR